VKNSSLGKFHYALRPAKNMERKMFCEAFARLSRLAPLTKYRYIGFGSTEFCDFRIFHERLGIVDMVSIEGREDQRKRVEFNCPHSCIDIKWGLSHLVLPSLDWPRRAIVWLDYDSALDAEKLNDIELVAGIALSGSVLVVTVPVEPGDSTAADAVNKRLSDLKQRVGAAKVPSSVQARDLSKWGMAQACREIINNQILETLINRGAPQSSSSRLQYKQLFNFHYADGTRMLTVGGVFLDGKDLVKLPVQEHFEDLEFVRFDKAYYDIESPILTWREMRLLDQKLPGTAVSPDWLPENEREKYRKVYRYYPNFTEVEA